MRILVFLLALCSGGAVGAQQPRALDAVNQLQIEPVRPLPTNNAALTVWEPGAAAPGELEPPTDRPRVPSIEPGFNQLPQDAAVMTPPPPVNLFSGTDSTLTLREEANLASARRFLDGSSALADAGAAGIDGSVVFRFGGVMPTIVCAPLYVCNLGLQAGETVNTVQVGDPVRWKVTPALSGRGESQVTHVSVKPLDIGLATNLIVTTDRRAYLLKLVSRKDDWMPSITFSYPEDEAAQWAAIAAQREAEVAATIIPDTGQNLADLDFGYRIRGDEPAWRPVRVYTDGMKTFIQFPRAARADELPALVGVGADDREQIVNFRLAGDRFVVDQVLSRAWLVAGVGRNQVRVKIERTGER